MLTAVATILMLGPFTPLAPLAGLLAFIAPLAAALWVASRAARRLRPELTAGRQLRAYAGRLFVFVPTFAVAGFLAARLDANAGPIALVLSAAAILALQC